ncbi:MFS transporter [Dyella sp. 2RAB6]|uniref:MFS transporter n=1 Tax=Dyella sp. 2RAB6 TaxID=3232992 RepID=UPI003F91CE3D
MSKPLVAAHGECAAESETHHPATRWALAGLALSMLLPSLDTSIANTSLPVLAKAFGATFQQVQWVVLAYLLAITTLIVGAGRLGDLLGRRRLLLVGIFCFTFASALCGLSSQLWLLIAARAEQGLGAAIMLALTIASVSEAVPRERIGRAMGLLGTMSAIGTALGPSLGGVLASAFGWPSIFLVNVPLGIVAFALVSRHMPKERPEQKRTHAGFDPIGTVLLALTLAAYALAMTLGHGQLGALNLTLLLAAFVGAALFAYAQTRVASPLIRLSMLRHAGFSASLAINALVCAVMMTTFVVGPFYLSRTLGLAPTWVGLVLSAGPCVAALSGMPAGRLVDRLGSRRTTLLGLIGIACGTSLLSALARSPAWLGVAGYIGPIAVTTMGYALFQASNNTAVMSGVTTDQRGVVSGMLSLSRNLGFVSGASAMAGVFAFAVGTSDVANATAAAVASGMRITFGVAAGLMVLAMGMAFRRRLG